MGKMKEEVRWEMKFLPCMLGKVIGGLMAAVGFPAVVLILTRKSAPSFADILPYALLGALGLAVFVLSAKSLAKRMAADAGPAPRETRKTSIWSWVIFLGLVGLFLLVVFLLTRQG